MTLAVLLDGTVYIVIKVNSVGIPEPFSYKKRCILKGLVDIDKLGISIMFQISKKRSQIEGLSPYWPIFSIKRQLEFLKFTSKYL